MDYDFDEFVALMGAGSTTDPADVVSAWEELLAYQDFKRDLAADPDFNPTER